MLFRSFRYTGVYAYGAVLSDQEKPSANDKYAIKTDSGFIINKLIDKVTKPMGDALRLINRNVGIDTSINIEMRIWTRGQTLSITRWGDLPARIIYMDGRSVDVYPNSAEYKQLDQTITPTTRDVHTLEVHMNNNTTLVFFGDGIDLLDIETPYQALMEAKNMMDSLKNKKQNNIIAPSETFNKQMRSAYRPFLPQQSNITIQPPQWNTTIPVDDNNTNKS